MHRRLAGLRHTAPALSIPSGSGPDSLTPDVELSAPSQDVMIREGRAALAIFWVEDEQALARAYTAHTEAARPGSDLGERRDVGLGRAQAAKLRRGGERHHAPRS